MAKCRLGTEKNEQWANECNSVSYRERQAILGLLHGNVVVRDGVKRAMFGLMNVTV
jgi:hypothetical protein